MTDGTHQHSARVVKLSAAGRLIDAVRPWIRAQRGRGQRSERIVAPHMGR